MNFIEWLEQYFVQPLGLLGLLAIPIIIIIYLIKARYVQRPVSSTFIWKRSLKYVKRKIPMSLIVSLLLIIQILTIITASLAIARMRVKPIQSEEVILIVDASASMKTQDQDGKTRFDLAKEKISEFAEKANSSNQVTVIVVSNKESTTTKCERLESKLDVNERLNTIECTDYTITDEGLQEAIRLAKDIRDNHNPFAKIKFITDKPYSIVENLEIINVARDTDKNVSILSGTHTEVNKKIEFKAELTSFGYDGFGSECTIQLDINDGYKKYVKTIQVPDAGENPKDPKTVEVIFTSTNRASTEDKIYVKIEAISEFEKATFSVVARDSLADDNSYSIFATEKRTPSILMVSSNFVVDSNGKIDTNKPTALQAALSSNGYVLRSENMYTSIPDDMKFEGFDLYIFEGVDIPASDKLPVDGAIWIIDPKSLPTGDKSIGLTLGEKYVYTDEDKLYYQMYKTSGTDTESLAYKTITNMVDKSAYITEYTEIRYDGSNIEQIFSCNQQENHPALLAGTHTTKNGTVRMVVTSFNFRKSSWAAMVVEYPILIGNLLKYSVPEAVSQTEQFTIGDETTFNAPAGAKTISVYHDGTLIKAYDSVASFDMTLDKVGLYEIVVGFADSTAAEKHYYLPTGIDKDESALTIIGDMILGPEVNETENVDRVEIFWYLIALLLLLLVVEWGVYHRDGF